MNRICRTGSAGLILGFWLLSSLGCTRQWPGGVPPLTANPAPSVLTPWVEPEAGGLPGPLLTLLPPAASHLRGTPTPDAIRVPAKIRQRETTHRVAYGESLASIARAYMVSTAMIAEANQLTNPDYLGVDQVLVIPPPRPGPPGPGFKILPDSELVYGPTAGAYNSRQDAARWGRALRSVSQWVDERSLDGIETVELVASRYSVNPMLLLAVLEFQAGWLSQDTIAAEYLSYPAGYFDPSYRGLFAQLSWVAEQLNRGYYQWRAGWAGPYVFADGSAVNPGAGINAGTAGVQYLFSQLYPVEQWRQVVGENGFSRVFTTIYGDPFARAVEPLVPPGLKQVRLQLPFAKGEHWSYTGGPHSAWAPGSAWAALDFAPPGPALGCVLSNAWVLAAADGLIMLTESGRVVQDLDGDGNEGTGWSLLYMHIDAWQRVEVGTYVRAGERIGHPSCEGGISSGTHLHLARRYNGEWIAADDWLPFNLDGWISSGYGQEYDGYLRRSGIRLEACACRNSANQVYR